MKKREVTANLYERLSKANKAMQDITMLMRFVTGDEATVQNEELDRLNKASNLGNDFLDYYNQNKIYFDTESCKLIEEIGAIFKSSHSIHVGLKQFNLGPSQLTSERTTQAAKMVREEAPPLIAQLEDRLRAILDE